MRRVLSISILALTVIALTAAGAFACGEDSTSIKKIDAEAKTVSSGKYVCDAAKNGEATAMATSSRDGYLTRTISVKGLTCAGSENSLKAALAVVPGVVEVVKVCRESEEAVVKVDPALAKDTELTKAITDKGYEAQIIPAVARTSTVKGKSKVCPLSGGPGCDASVAKTSTEKKVEDTK